MTKPRTIYRRNIFKTEEDNLKEECGIFGIYSSKPLSILPYIEFGLFSLQHRGQEAFGYCVQNEDESIQHFKKNGLVLDGFPKIETNEKHRAGIGHTRYSTHGGQSSKNIQPFYAKNAQDEKYLAIAHNGNIYNASQLKEDLVKDGLEFVSSNSDSEIILRILEKYYEKGIVYGVEKINEVAKGAYSVVGMDKNSVFAFKDPLGIRPLCYGQTEDGMYIFSSESCGLDAVQATFIKELLPGELIIIDENGIHSHLLSQEKSKICAFEYIYFARPDSVLNAVTVFQHRQALGELLYQQNPIEADVVVGIPDSGVPAAIGFSNASGIAYKPILIKNKYIGRSFIAPTNDLRTQLVYLKYNPINIEIKGKRLVLIDDSIVRGNTSKRLIQLFREAGAKEIHFRSASPKIISTCYYGIDTPSKENLLAANKTTEEMREWLGVDSLDFLSLPNLYQLLEKENHCTACFSTNYPI